MAKKTNIVPLSGSPEARARMARWLESRLGYEPGALDDHPLPPIEQMADTPFLRFVKSLPKSDDFSYTPVTIDLASDDEDA